MLKILFILCVLISAPAAADVLPYRQDAGLSKVEFLLNKGNYSQALEEADSVLKRHPNNADALTYQGYAWMKLGDAEKARKSFEAALKSTPAHLGANAYLAQIYLAQNETARAVEQMQVLRAICGNAHCAELSDLQQAINDASRK